MTEITRGQFAIAAVIVAVLAWVGARAMDPGTPPQGGAASASAAPTTAGEPGTGGDAGGGADAVGAGVTVTRAPAKRIVVHVAGAVHRPGVYRLSDGQRIADAVRRAGGGTRRADLDAINLAAKARDGVQILVPRKVAGAGTAPGAAAPSTVAPATGGATAGGAASVIDLNTATAEQLETLDGVGPATSAKILQYRTEHGPFRSVDDLEQIPGIGPKKLAAMRARVRV
ncbi:MAG: ComEA family DNA-binding protein [Solirubrobacterales bacterium]|nr:ComEA family DNA-binding protein [Solirubrobacterales bacterium]